jgi:hypothetical protein
MIIEIGEQFTSNWQNDRSSSEQLGATLNLKRLMKETPDFIQWTHINLQNSITKFLTSFVVNLNDARPDKEFERDDSVENVKSIRVNQTYL